MTPAFFDGSILHGFDVKRLDAGPANTGTENCKHVFHWESQAWDALYLSLCRSKQRCRECKGFRGLGPVWTMTFPYVTSTHPAIGLVANLRLRAQWRSRRQSTIAAFIAYYSFILCVYFQGVSDAILRQFSLPSRINPLRTPTCMWM